MQNTAPGESSAAIRERIIAARIIQAKRFANSKTKQTPCNARMTHSEIRAYCPIDKAQAELLSQAMEQLSLSARAYDRILKVARTIADLAGTENIEAPHLMEAIQYRSLDRALFY
jgi:magnesium chelatase family protein